MEKPLKIKHVHAYAIGDSVLEHVSSEKDLGVVSDNTLSFEEHIVNKVKKANSMVGLIRRSENVSYTLHNIFQATPGIHT